MLFTQTGAGEDPAGLLGNAWREYQFQTYGAARAFFSEVLKTAGTPEQKWEALIGLGMISHFSEKERDLAKALDVYSQVLNAGADGKFAAMAKSMQSLALAGQGELSAANQGWEEVITAYSDTIIAQDALLSRTLYNMKAFDAPETLHAIEYLEGKRHLFPEPTPEEPGLSPAFDMIRGDVYFWRKEYHKAVKAYLEYIRIGRIGTISYGNRATVLFKIARIAEEYLDDPQTAGEYYKRIVEETPNDVRSYFALEKAIQYGAVSPEEVQQLRLSGMDDDVIQDLFSTHGGKTDN